MSMFELTPRENRPLSDVTVLIADDDVRIGKLIQSVLHGLGFGKVECCHNGSEALAILRKQHVDLMICDWQMSPMNGIELLEYLRGDQNSPAPTLPVIMLSGHSEIDEVEEARDAGVTEYVIKPFTARSLCSRIITIINKPRQFVLHRDFKGPDRRRRGKKVTDERRK